MRTLYLLASYLLMPPLLLFLAMRDTENRKRWPERLGYYQRPPPGGGIVIHAASVGEVNAAASLLRALAEELPDLPITLTSFTATGSSRVRSLFAGAVHHVYLPLDLPGPVRRFFNTMRPRILIIMETEIWPQLYAAAAKSGIPMMMANARISEDSVKRYRYIGPLIRAALAQVTRIAAQSESDAARLIDIGAPASRTEVTGNMKFDLSLPDGLAEQGVSLRREWGEQRPVFLAASTHGGDEGPVLEAFLGLLNTFPDALLVLAPRHPQRFQRAAQMARAAGLPVQLHSRIAAHGCGAQTQCLVVDEMGVLLQYYAACDVAFVGGSLARTGGQNVLEPAALAIPVLVGPHTQHFEDVTRQLLASGGARRVGDAAELERAVTQLLGNAALRREMGAAGQALVESRKGAVTRSLGIIGELLDHSSS